MKNKIVLLLFVLFLVVGCNKEIIEENNIVSTITLDINPSIEINLDKDDRVVSIIALNEDANNIIDNYEGKSLDETIDSIINNVVEKGYVEDDYVSLILYSKGNINSDTVKNKIEDKFHNKDVRVDIVVVENISSEDEELAKKYNVSPAKVSYVKEISNESENITIDDFIDKTANELRDSKERKMYCDKDYILEGDWCIKETTSKAASTGEVCPKNYYEYKGKCYEERGVHDTGNFYCDKEYELDGTDCIKKNYIKAVVAEYTCPKGLVKTKGEVGAASYGSGPARDVVCVDADNITHPVTVCNLPKSDPTERMSYGGKCYWHRAPVIASGCPGKKQVKGFCWDDASGVYLCPNGYNSNTRSKDDNCYKVLKNVKPVASSYKCDNEEMILEGDKCLFIERKGAYPERTCDEGFTLIDNDKCINLNKIASKEKGYVCEGKDVKLKGNECVFYERIEAKSY